MAASVSTEACAPAAAGGGRRPARRSAAATIDRVIAEIDRLMAEQVDAIIHHPRFQRLEAAWRGLAWLVAGADDSRTIKIRVLSLSWSALVRDFERSVEFDQSALFNKIYSSEFDMPGGEPFGIVVADYEPTIHPRDVAALRELASVGAAAFCPIVLGCSPALFQLDSFAQFAPHLDVTGLFNSPGYRGWQAARRNDDCRFLAIALPRVLFRLPYRADGTRTDGFVYNEAAHGGAAERWLWGNAAYAFAATTIRSFAAYGWFADLRGAGAGRSAGGLVDRLPSPHFPTDRAGIALRAPIEVALSERHERELADLGFMPLMPVRLTQHTAFYSNQSFHDSARYDQPAARNNARLAAILQQVLCASRFAHFLKVIVRDKIGTFASADDCQRQLSDWIAGYCMANDAGSEQLKATYPLRDARIEVKEVPGRPGHYACVAHLQPQFQLDEINAVFRLVTVLQEARAA